MILCSILDSFYSGHILIKNAESALLPWLFTPEAKLGSATPTILSPPPIHKSRLRTYHVSGAVSSTGNTVANVIATVLPSGIDSLDTAACIFSSVHKASFSLF